MKLKKIKDKKIEHKLKSEYPKWQEDDLHISSEIDKVAGHNKMWNAVVCCRNAGKTSLMCKMIYNSFKYEDACSIVMKRRQVDLTDTWLSDFCETFKKFTSPDLNLWFKTADLKTGFINVYLDDYVLCRIQAMSTPLSRAKSLFLKDVKYVFYDEFICAVSLGESYIQSEFSLTYLYEIRNTYVRESKYKEKLKIWLFGNPYSTYVPLLAALNVPTTELYPGNMFTNQKCAVWCYTIKDKLKERILKEHPEYAYEDEYARYAFDGRSIEDRNIMVCKKPDNFTLREVFKIHGKLIGIWRGPAQYYNNQETFRSWSSILTGDISKYRSIIAFDFDQMSQGTVLINVYEKQSLSYLKSQIQYREIRHESVETAKLLEEIYTYL